MVSTMLPPNEAPHMAPKPYETFWTTWYIPRWRKGMRSELMMVATGDVSHKIPIPGVKYLTHPSSLIRRLLYQSARALC